MKKFERLPIEKRKEEIQDAALKLFNEKGFKATTMENIVAEVSLSKGGVYRIYPSTSAILGDLMIRGMHLRNAFYEERVKELTASKKKIDLEALVTMTGESLLLYPEFSKVYVEFLIEKKRDEALGRLYDEVCARAFADTAELIEKCGADIKISQDSLKEITEIMNTAILGIHVLGLEDFFKLNKEKLCRAVLCILEE